MEDLWIIEKCMFPIAIQVPLFVIGLHLAYAQWFQSHGTGPFRVRAAGCNGRPPSD